MLTTFQRDTYPFLIRCLFVCFSVIVRFSSPKRPLLLHRHKPFVANRPAPVFRETGSLPLRAVPTATHHGDCRQQRSVGREIGKRTACRQTMFVELNRRKVHQRRAAVPAHPVRAAAIANIGKSQPHMRLNCHSLLTFSNVRLKVGRSTPSPGNMPDTGQAGCFVGSIFVHISGMPS